MQPPVIGAVLPAFLVILLGFFLRSQRFPVYGFWRQAESITYVVFLPTLLFRSLATTTIELAQFLELGSVILLGYALQTAVCFALQFTLKLPKKTFAALYQGAIRFNNYIGIALIMALYGPTGIAIYAVIIAMAIPLSNLLNIAVMTHYASESDFSLWLVLRRIMRNPLIIGTMAGGVANLFSQYFPAPLAYSMPFINIIANAALPIGLMCVGAAISRQEVNNTRLPLLMVTTLKLGVFPIAMLAATYALGMTGLEQQVAVLFAALPCAASGTTIARQFGASVTLSANTTALTTLLSLLTLPAIVWILL